MNDLMVIALFLINCIDGVIRLQQAVVDQDMIAFEA